MPNITIQSLGRKKRNLPHWYIPLFPDLVEDEGENPTLRKLIERIVRNEVEAFRQRQEERKFHRFLSLEEIGAALIKGKVDMGGRDLEQEVHEEAAVGTAWQAFEDGLYLVFIDEIEKKDLDEEIYLTEDSSIRFIRLTMLAGG